MPQHMESDGETQQPAPEGPVEQRRVNDVAGETRESVADTVSPLRIAIENLASAVPDEDFARRYHKEHVGMFDGMDPTDIPVAVRQLLAQRQFNEALCSLIHHITTLGRPLMQEELRAIGDILRTTGDFHLHNFITQNSVEDLRSALPTLIRQHPSLLCTFLRYGTAHHRKASLSSITAHALLSSTTKELRQAIEDIFTQTLQEAASDPSFRPGEGLGLIVDKTLQHGNEPTPAICVTLRSLEYEIRQQELRGDDYYTHNDGRLRDFLTDPRLSRHTHMAVMRWLEEKGLNAEDVSDWWSDGAGWPVEKIPQFQALPDMEKAERILPYDCYMRNVRSCLQLEAHNPGSLQELSSSFNLHDVGRYAPETLVAQYEERENIHKPYVLVIYPRDDHNGAFFCNAYIIENLRQQLDREGYLLRIIEGGGRDIFKTLARLRRDERYPPPAGLILGAHGQPGSMSFSNQHPLSLKTVWEKTERGLEVRIGGMEKGMEKLFRRKAKGCPTVLISCSTGQPEGIAHVISQYTEGTVSGPQIPTNVAAIRAQFDENGQLTAFVPTFHGGKPGTFMAGKEVPVAEEDVLEAIPVEEELPPEEKQ